MEEPAPPAGAFGEEADVASLTFGGLGFRV